jgi:hypothetical protein
MMLLILFWPLLPLLLLHIDEVIRRAPALGSRWVPLYFSSSSFLSFHLFFLPKTNNEKSNK